MTSKEMVSLRSFLLAARRYEAGEKKEQAIRLIKEGSPTLQQKAAKCYISLV
jgi:hypothetical protein